MHCDRLEQRTDVDFVRFTESQVRPWIEKTERFVAFIDDLIQREPEK